MACFILEIAGTGFNGTMDEQQVKKICNAIVDKLDNRNLTSGIISVKCIDNSNQNQFEDELEVENEKATNYFSHEQLEQYKKNCNE